MKSGERTREETSRCDGKHRCQSHYPTIDAVVGYRGHGNQQNAGRALTRGCIFERVWGFDSEAGWEVIKVYVNYLCAKLNAGGRLNIIHTVRGVGYILKP